VLGQSSCFLVTYTHNLIILLFLFLCSRFDDWLQGQDPSFGVRNLEDVVRVAHQAGVQLAETIEMPANTLCLVFRRRRDE
jgi:Protein of unknown function (DUF938)